MKISMISEHASPLAPVGSIDAGGQNVHVGELSRALGAKGHDVRVYTRRTDEDSPDRVAFAPNVSVINVAAGPPAHLPKDELLPYMATLGDMVAVDWILHGAPDVVHAHFWMSGLAGLIATDDLEAVRGVRVPLVQTFHALGVVKRRHQGTADTSPPEREWLEPAVGKLAHEVVATCADEVCELTTLGVPEERIAIAPCGVDLDLFRPEGPRERKTHAVRLLSIGRLVPRKGVDLVIRAMRLLVDAGIDAELLVVGSCDANDPNDLESRMLREIARHCEVADRVHFRGQVSQRATPELYRSADAVVCTPWYEPFGIVPLEAMACGVPVIAAAVGGLADTVVDGVTGVHVPPHDPAAIAQAALSLIENPGKRARFGRSGRERVEHGYSWSQVAEDTLRAYHTAVATSLSIPRAMFGGRQ
jgi:glycosyltransferase involved in cell wall biosynthesis